MIDVKTKIIETRKAYSNTYYIKETVTTITDDLGYCVREYSYEVRIKVLFAHKTLRTFTDSIDMLEENVHEQSRAEYQKQCAFELLDYITKIL